LLNIGVCGYYGMGNFGDELFLKTFKQIFHNHNVFPWSAFVDPNQIDAVIIGGGDLITPYYYNQYYFPPLLENHPTWIYGVGVVDHYNEDTWPVEQIDRHRQRLSKAKKVYLRDDNSARIFKKYNLHKEVKVAPDVVFAYEQPKYPIRKYAGVETIGICVSSYDDFPFQKIVNLLVKLTQKGYHVFLIPVVNQSNNKYSDYTLCRNIRNALLESNPRAAVTLPYNEYDLEMTYSLIQSVDYLISFKLHPALVAIRNEIPTFCFSKMSKVKSLLKMFHLEDFSSDFEIPEQDMIEKVLHFLNLEKDKFSNIKSQVELVESNSMRNLLELKEDIEKTIKKGSS